MQFAPLVPQAPASGNVGTWNATSSFSNARSSHMVVEHNGYVYVMGGDCGFQSFDDVQYARVDEDGAIGPWAATTSLPTWLTAHTCVTHNGFMYLTTEISMQLFEHADVFCAPDPFSVLNDVQFATLQAPAAQGFYSRLVDLGQDAELQSILINGATARNGRVRAQLRIAPSDTAQFGAESIIENVPLGSAVSINEVGRYLWLRLRLDDTRTVCSLHDDSGARNVTDLTINFVAGDQTPPVPGAGGGGADPE